MENSNDNTEKPKQDDEFANFPHLKQNWTDSQDEYTIRDFLEKLDQIAIEKQKPLDIAYLSVKEVECKHIKLVRTEYIAIENLVISELYCLHCGKILAIDWKPLPSCFLFKNEARKLSKKQKGS
jgi:hypothetical protein